GGGHPTRARERHGARARTPNGGYARGHRGRRGQVVPRARAGGEMSEQLDSKELERRLLHALLLEHGGMTVEDVAAELGLTRAAAEELLDAELGAGLVDLRVEDQVYVSLRRVRPASAALVRAELEHARERARRR